MTVTKFPEGNVLLLYANNRGTVSNEKIQIPEHIANRIKVCRSVYDRILKSKPDAFNT